ncbi:Prokaryotic N-terminal methylation motif domain protein [Verrucomicrobiia bacterium DG1235]|nr:Prokaryotic N-terminal methylation motif domain protein [Verrucomicrobiae bacterium DG1235]
MESIVCSGERLFARARSGFSVIELLFVVVVMGILVNLLLPAMQSVREAARRAEVGRNIVMVAEALSVFSDAEADADAESVPSEAQLLALEDLGFESDESGRLVKDGYIIEFDCPSGPEDCLMIAYPFLPGRTGDRILYANMDGEVLSERVDAKASAEREAMFVEVRDRAVAWLEAVAGRRANSLSRVDEEMMLGRLPEVFDELNENWDDVLSLEEMVDYSLRLDDAELRFSEILEPLMLGAGGEDFEATPGISLREIEAYWAIARSRPSSEEVEEIRRF